MLACLTNVLNSPDLYIEFISADPWAALQVFCLLNPQMNAWDPNLNTTYSDFNGLKSAIKNFYLHAIFKSATLPFKIMLN